jgi:hypothetical protein
MPPFQSQFQTRSHRAVTTSWHLVSGSLFCLGGSCSALCSKHFSYPYCVPGPQAAAQHICGGVRRLLSGSRTPLLVPRSIRQKATRRSRAHGAIDLTCKLFPHACLLTSMCRQLQPQALGSEIQSVEMYPVHPSALGPRHGNQQRQNGARDIL